MRLHPKLPYEIVLVYDFKNKFKKFIFLGCHNHPSLVNQCILSTKKELVVYHPLSKMQLPLVIDTIQTPSEVVMFSPLRTKAMMPMTKILLCYTSSSRDPQFFRWEHNLLWPGLIFFLKWQFKNTCLIHNLTFNENLEGFI